MKVKADRARSGASRALKAGGVAAALALGGCGGGGTGAGTESTVVFSGVAATGAPMAGAVIKVISATGDLACQTRADAAGRYDCTLEAGSTAPFAIVADDGEQTHYSSAAEAVTGTINVTPLTSLVVARLSTSGDPSRFAAEIQADPGVATAAKVEARVAEVSALIAPLTAAAGDGANLLTGRFSADGTAHDKVLDSLQITIRPEGDASNIELTMKVAPARDDAAPVAVSFRSDAATPPPPPVASLRPQDLAGSGIARQVEAFLERMRACYALPLAQRIRGVAEGATSASGGPDAVLAPECRGLFVDDDPATFLDNGLTVGARLGFPGMFTQAATGAAFDHGNHEHAWANGDLLITFRSTTVAGAIAHSTLTLRLQGDRLKAIGNHYAYDASVRPYTFHREFPLQSAFNYVGTGYNVNIANRIGADGEPVFKEAVVTTPTGRQLLYRPLPGRSMLGLVRANGETSGTSVEVFAAAYAEPTTHGNPTDKDTSLVFAAQQLTDEQLRSIPDHGAWAIEWVHADPAVPNVRQVYRTIERAATIGEARHQSFAQFSPGLKAAWLARADVQAFLGLTFPAAGAESPNVLTFEAPGGGDGWSVPEGAPAPSHVNVFGFSAGGARFNDGVSVSGVDRQATVSCSKQSNADLHCDDSSGPGQFAQGGRVWTLELWGRTIRQIERATQVALWRLPE